MSPSDTQYLEIVVNLHAAFNDFKKMKFWLETKNPNFGNIAPIKLIALGRGHKVLNFIINALDEGNYP